MEGQNLGPKAPMYDQHTVSTPVQDPDANRKLKQSRARKQQPNRCKARGVKSTKMEEPDLAMSTANFILSEKARSL